MVMIINIVSDQLNIDMICSPIGTFARPPVSGSVCRYDVGRRDRQTCIGLPFGPFLTAGSGPGNHHLYHNAYI